MGRGEADHGEEVEMGCDECVWEQKNAYSEVLSPLLFGFPALWSFLMTLVVVYIVLCGQKRRYFNVVDEVRCAIFGGHEKKL